MSTTVKENTEDHGEDVSVDYDDFFFSADQARKMCPFPPRRYPNYSTHFRMSYLGIFLSYFLETGENFFYV